MSNQIKFNDSILDEVIPIYLDSVSTKERLESDILRLQGEVEELKLKYEQEKEEKTKLIQKLYKSYVKKGDKIAKITRFPLNVMAAIIGLCLNIAVFSLPFIAVPDASIYFFSNFLTLPTCLTSLTTGALLIFVYVKYGNQIYSFYSKFLYKHSKKYRELKDSYEKDKKKHDELENVYPSLVNTISQKEKEIDNKRRELEKLSPAIESMERKIGKKLIRERAVMFGVPSEILDIMQNIDEILEPNQESLEEGKGQFTLTTPTI